MVNIDLDDDGGVVRAIPLGFLVLVFGIFPHDASLT